MFYSRMAGSYGDPAKAQPWTQGSGCPQQIKWDQSIAFFHFWDALDCLWKIKQIASSILTSGLWLLPLQWGSRLLLVARASLWVSCVCPSLWLCDCTAAVVLVGCYSTFFFVWSSKDLEEVWIPKISVHENCILRGTDLSGLFWIGTTL